MRRLVPLVAAILLVGCQNSGSSGDAQTRVYQAKNAYEVALIAAVQYNSLPRCGQPASPPICSDQATVETIRHAAADARVALDAAEKTVRDPSSSSSGVQFALNAANNAVTALQTVLPKGGK